MANRACKVLVTEAPLERAADTAAATADVGLGTGVVVDFWGVVRPLEDGRQLEGIHYEAHRAMAQHQLRVIAEQAAEKFGLTNVIAYHRIGFVRAGEASLFLRVKAKHRAEAFQASKWIVDELKKRVPIWKKPRFLSPAAVGGGGDSGAQAPRHSEAATI